MKTLELRCDECGTRFPARLRDASVDMICPRCQTAVWIEVFPALLRETATGRPGEALLIEDESSCFYHPGKKAVVPCDACGRFLCALCDVEFDGRRLCPACIEAGAKKGKLEGLQKEATYYDEIALAVAVIPLLLFWITIITAPAALYIAIRYWNAPMGAAPRSKWRFVLAMWLAGLQVLGWVIAGMAILGA